MKTAALIFALSLLSTIALGQFVQSEVPIVLEDGVVKAKRITVSFNENVIPTNRGTSTVDISQYPIINTQVSTLMSALTMRFGTPVIRKSIPSVLWGDTLVLNRRTQQLVRVPEMSQLFTMDFPTLVPLDSVIGLFAALPCVEYAHKPISIVGDIVPNDTYFPNQWHLNNPTNDADIDAPEAWDITPGSSSIKIAVIDQSGSLTIQNHQDFQLVGGGNKFVGGDETMGSEHALAVAGLLGATTNNGQGVAGVGWNTSLLGYYFNTNGQSNTHLPGLIELAVVETADVINCSFHTVEYHAPPINKYCPFDFPSVRNAIANAVASGVVVVAAAGNTSIVGCDEGQVPYSDQYPAAYPNVIGVSATTENDLFNIGYNYGAHVFCAAPGTNIWSTLALPSSYGNVGSGTSASTPIVSGVVSLIFSINPSLTVSQVSNIIQQTADKVGQYPYSGGRNDYLGYGRVNANKAVKAAIPNRYSVPAVALPQTMSSGYHIITRPAPDPGGTITYNINGNLDLVNGGVLVVENNIRIVAEAGETLTLSSGSRVVLEAGAELSCNSGGTINDNASEVIFQGTNARISTAGGLLKFGVGVVRRVNNGGVIASTQSGTIELRTNTQLKIESGGELRWSAGSMWQFNPNAKLEVSGLITIADLVTLTFPSTADVQLKPGAEVKFALGAKLLSNGIFSATGTPGNLLKFTSSRPSPAPGDWQLLELKGGPNTLSYCLVEYSQSGVYFSNLLTNLLESSTVRYTVNYGVQSFNTSLAVGSVTVRDCIIENNGYGATVQNGRLDIVQTSNSFGIKTNTYGINVWTGGKLYMKNSYVTNNNDWGIYVNGTTAHASLSPDGIARGDNRVRDNLDGQIRVVAGGAFLGNTSTACECGPIEDGMQIGPRDGGGLDISCNPPCYVVPVKYGGYNRVSGNYPWIKNEVWPGVPARLTYWGNPQECPVTSPSSAFPGPGTVDYTECQTDQGNSPSLSGELFQLRYSADETEPPYLSPDSVMGRRVVRLLKEMLLSGHRDAKQAIHQLASLVGPGGTFANELGTPWKGFVRFLLTRNLPSDTKNLIRAYVLQEMMDVKQFGNAIAYADSLIAATTDDELWFHAQSSVVYALVANGDIQQANSRFQSFKSQGEAINPDATAHLEYFLGMQQGEGSSSSLLRPRISATKMFDKNAPTKTSLSQNFPNPYNPSTTIKYELVQDSHVSLKVYDMIGREVYSLVDANSKAGSYEIPFDGTKLASGMYFYKLTAGTYTEVRKMVLMK